MTRPGIFILLPLVIASGLAQDVSVNCNRHIAFSNSRTCTRMTLTHPVQLGQIGQPRAKPSSNATSGRNSLVRISGKAELKLTWGYGAWFSTTTITRDNGQADYAKAIAALLKNNSPPVRNKSSG